MKPSVGLKVRPARKTGFHVKRHDVGGQMMTTREIAARIGGTTQTVRARLAKGWKGKELLMPINSRRSVGLPRVSTQIVAYKIARQFPDSVPTTAQIRAIHPMQVSTATYWRNAIMRAMRELDGEY